MTRLHLYHDETPPDVDDDRTCPECGAPINWRGWCPDCTREHYEDDYGLEF